MNLFKKLLKIIFVIFLIFVGSVFFLNTNSGIGFIEFANNWTRGDPSIPSISEIVIPADSILKATTAEGTITIKAEKGLKRYYTWDGDTRYVIMWPRQERWNGSLGIYYPGPGCHWLDNHGICRGVLEEGQQHFDTIEKAKSWLEHQIHLLPYQNGKCVHNDTGLLVCFAKQLKANTLEVAVWQIYVRGKKPTQLEGSNDSAIQPSW